MEKEEIRNNETGYIKLSKNETLKGIKYNWEIKLLGNAKDLVDELDLINNRLLAKYSTLEF